MMPTTNETSIGPAPPEILLTRSEVARILGVAPTTVTRWAREGRLACRLTLGGHHRYPSSVIDEVRANMSRTMLRTPASNASRQLREVKS